MSLKRTIATALVFASLPAPAALAYHPEDRLAGAAQASATQDLRSPDARDAATAADLGGPKAREGLSAVVSPTSGDFPWLEVGLVAGLGLTAAGVGAVSLRQRSRMAHTA